MKYIIILSITFLILTNCQQNKINNIKKNKKVPLVENVIKEDSTITKKINNFKLIGYYFPIKMKECDFWIEILKKNDTLQYLFFNNYKINKKGKLIIKTEENKIYLNFKNSFNAEFYKDTIVFQNYGNSINSFEHIPYCGLKYITLIKKDRISKDELVFFNDKAYYLEQSGLYPEAIFLLEKIIKIFPNRTVAYINLGDAYWSLNKKELAKKMYNIYIKQMKANKKEHKIPNEVYKKLNN